MKIQKILPIIFVILFLTTFGAAQEITQNLTLDGLKKKVTVRRDARSIPYIEAENEADLYFAQGFITAGDRLWQMDLLRRMARGELAEIFGKDVLEEDKRWRRYDFSGIAQDSLKQISPQLLAALNDYARGVNAYIATLNDKTLPVEFKILKYQPRPWSPTDTIVIGKILAEGLSSTWRLDLIRASLQNLPKEKLADLTNNQTPWDVVLIGKDSKVQSSRSKAQSKIAVSDEDLEMAENDARVRENSLSRVGFYAEELAASNNWVISGKRTADGKPILANDPHLQAAAPGIWYLTHLSMPNLRVSGVTFPGVPGIILGHNQSIAWGATNVGPDVQDLYRETLNDKGEYQTPDGWQKIAVRREEIKVRKNPLSPETTTETLEVQETRHGVIISDETGQKFALQWTARDPKNQEFEAFFALNRAQNWTDFQNALKTYGGAAQNFVYADVKGNIGWYAAGKIPVRRVGDGSLPYDGTTRDGDWVGYIPFEELPHLYNPPEGFIVTANQRTTGTDYKYFDIFSRDAANPWRARRIYNLLKSNTSISMDNVRDVQHDVFSQVHFDLAREIMKEEAATPETLAALRVWEGKMTADSKAALLVNEIRNCTTNKIAAENKPVPPYIIREKLLYWIINENTTRWLPSGFTTFKQLLKSCDEESRQNLTKSKNFGTDETKWQWGGSFVANFQHPLAIAPLIGAQFVMRFTNVNGSGLTPNVGASVSMRHIASPGNWDATRHVIPLGESGNPESPFWKDQFEAWRTGTPMIFPFSKEAVQKSTVEIWTLQPK